MILLENPPVDAHYLEFRSKASEPVEVSSFMWYYAIPVILVLKAFGYDKDGPEKDAIHEHVKLHVKSEAYLM
jgi:hypothetical protein